MAEVLTEFPKRSNSGRGSRYECFYDGQVWQIDPSDSGAKTVTALRAQLHDGAKRRGLKLKTCAGPENTWPLIVQAVKP